MQIEEPYHSGELHIQERVGEEEQGRRNGAAISNTILQGALPFISRQAFAVLGSVDSAGRVWASLLAGEPGFMHPEDERTVVLDLKRAARNLHDPLWDNLQHDARAGMLLIELSTRRRLRINGRVHRSAADRLWLKVQESYPNCPKYIQRRNAVSTWRPGRNQDPGTLISHGRSLDRQHLDMVANADTLFVASANPRGGVDASHRGGPPGFVQVHSETTLRIPDYHGNSMYNTLGNFLVHPYAGLMIPDFSSKRILQLTGRPVIHWNLDDAHNHTGGTGRYWDLHIDHRREYTMPRGMHWEYLDASPHNPVTMTMA